MQVVQYDAVSVAHDFLQYTKQDDSLTVRMSVLQWEEWCAER